MLNIRVFEKNRTLQGAISANYSRSVTAGQKTESLSKLHRAPGPGLFLQTGLRGRAEGTHVRAARSQNSRRAPGPRLMIASISCDEGATSKQATIRSRTHAVAFDSPQWPST